MKHTLLHRFAILALTFGTFLSAASLAHAETFTLPQQFSYAGLTFSDPLTYDGPLTKPTTKISFSHPQILEINKNTKKKSLEALVVTPTYAAEQTKKVAPLLMPTPTLYLKPTVAQLASMQTTATPAPTSKASVVTPTTAQETPVPQANTGGLNPETLFSMVNSYRQTKGLPAFQKDDKTCSLASSRAPEIAGEIAGGTMHSGLQARNLPYWNTENIISMNSEAAAFNWWINDTIHRQAIESSNTYSCVACSGNACAEEFTSYHPK